MGRSLTNASFVYIFLIYQTGSTQFHLQASWNFNFEWKLNMIESFLPSCAKIEEPKMLGLNI